jgi:hypothetical protein
VRNEEVTEAKRTLTPASVTTAARVLASAEEVWDDLMFYEEISLKPPLLLRLLIPTPVRAEGRAAAAGDLTRCLYRSGHLVKRATGVDVARHYRFQVVEQELRIGGGVRLVSGSYELDELSDGTTRLEIQTRYWSPWRPRWVWRAIETAVCHAFHRHILRAMRLEMESRAEVSTRGGIADREAL